MILQVADTSADVMILGETGTGKELVARCLHQFSRRRDHNFVAINCGAMPETMFESEVFGHESGAFTGASRQRIGRLEYADGGTLLLDEIESMPLSLQVKLLRALQEHTIERLGSNREIPIDARIVAATKDDLGKSSRQQKFRSDLYYRLNVVSVELPPLRDRREDIPLLFEHFVLKAATRYHRDAPVLSETQRRQLMAYNWPGNVRELRNVAERFVLGVHGTNLDLIKGGPGETTSFAEQVDAYERAILSEAMSRHEGNIAAVSDNLKLPRKTPIRQTQALQSGDRDVPVIRAAPPQLLRPAEVHGYELRDSPLAHGDAEQAVHAGHGQAVVGDDQEAGGAGAGHFLDQACRSDRRWLRPAARPPRPVRRWAPGWSGRPRTAARAPSAPALRRTAGRAPEGACRAGWRRFPDRRPAGLSASVSFR